MTLLRQSRWAAAVPVVRGRRFGADRAAVAPIHHRPVPQHHVDRRRVVLGRRVAHSLLVEQDGDLERVCGRGDWRRMDANHVVHDRLHLRGVVLSEGRSDPVHARPGRERAESPLRPRQGRTGAGSHPRREAQSLVRRLDPDGGRSSCPRTSATPAISISIATTVPPTSVRWSTRTSTATFPSTYPVTKVGGDDQAQYHQRHRHLSLERGHQSVDPLDATSGCRAVSPATFDPAARYLDYLSNDGSEVHAVAAVRARRRHARGRREGRLGHHLHLLLADRPLPGDRGESGRPRHHLGGRERQRQTDRAAGDSERRHRAAWRSPAASPGWRST